MTLTDLSELFLRYDGVLFAILLLWMVILSRQRARYQALVDEFARLKAGLEQQQNWSSTALELTLARLDEVKTGLLEQAKAVARIQSSPKVTEHLEVLEKVILTSEHLEKLKQTLDQSWSDVLEMEKSRQPERGRETQTHFKQQTDLARKNLERTLTEKLAAALGERNREEPTTTLINSLRHSILLITKYHLDSIQALSKSSLEELEAQVKTARENLRARIDDLKQRLDEAPALLRGTKEPKA